jgi:hypothetical protein
MSEGDSGATRRQGVGRDSARIAEGHDQLGAELPDHSGRVGMNLPGAQVGIGGEGATHLRRQTEQGLNVAAHGRVGMLAGVNRGDVVATGHQGLNDWGQLDDLGPGAEWDQDPPRAAFGAHATGASGSPGSLGGDEAMPSRAACLRHR